MLWKAAWCGTAWCSALVSQREPLSTLNRVVRKKAVRSRARLSQYLSCVNHNYGTRWTNIFVRSGSWSLISRKDSNRHREISSFCLDVERREHSNWIKNHWCCFIFGTSFIVEKSSRTWLKADGKLTLKTSFWWKGFDAPNLCYM